MYFLNFKFLLYFYFKKLGPIVSSKTLGKKTPKVCCLLLWHFGQQIATKVSKKTKSTASRLFPEAANSHKSVEKTKSTASRRSERESDREKRKGREEKEKRRSRARDTEKKRDIQADRRRKSPQEEEKRESQKWWNKFGDYHHHHQQQENASGVEDY